jgi:hypothetical protein
VVERRSVAVGRLTRSERFGDGLEILTGLVEGEMVVTAGVSKITGGQQVSLLAEGNG